MEAAQRLDDQVIDRHPDRPTPVRLAAELSRVRFSWHIADTETTPGMLENKWVALVMLGDAPDAEIGQELSLVEHTHQEAFHAAAAQQ